MASAKQRGGGVKLVAPSKFVVQTLKLIGVLNLFEILTMRTLLCNRSTRTETVARPGSGSVWRP